MFFKDRDTNSTQRAASNKNVMYLVHLIRGGMSDYGIIG